MLIWEITAVSILVLHLLCVQLAAAGPVVAVLLEWRGRSKVIKPESRASLHKAAERLAGHAVAALALGVVSGLILAWLAVAVGQRDYSGVLRRFYGRVGWGGIEIVFSGIITVIYWRWFRRGPIRPASRAVHRLLALVSTTNLLYHFPSLLAVMVDHQRVSPDLVAEVTSSEYRSLIFAPAVVAKSVHFAIASVAVTAAWVMFWNAPPSNVDSPADSAIRQPTSVVRMGAWIALAALVFQMLSGIWLVMQAAPADRARLMGADWISSGLLLLSILMSMIALNQTANVAMGDVDGNQPRLAASMIGIVVLFMVVVSTRLSGLI